MKVIRLTRVEVWEYMPDLDSDFYLSENIKTIEDAMVADESDIEKGRLSILELVDEPKSIHDTWEIVEKEELS